jgi:phospho-N-acetylmuramoyl-pentapeptide-transferase
LLAGILSLIIGLIFLPLLKKLKLKQSILGYVKEHKSKEGTPTMGGIIFLLSSSVAFLLFKKGESLLSTLSLIISVSFCIVGLIDDFIKIKNSRNLGLTSLQKILFQTAIALISSIFLYKNAMTSIYIPYTLKFVDLGFISIFLNFFIFIATVNSVNLVDGLDGLCTSTTFVYLLAISIIGFIELTFNANAYANIQEYKNVFLYAISVSGALLGFLVFNTNKASVFMGDTGSLMLGGVVSTISIFTANQIYILLVGIMFVITALSVIIQVAVFKKTKKRVFLMSPLHHPFQMKGISENKIATVYSLITLVMALIVIICIL